MRILAAAFVILTLLPSFSFAQTPAGTERFFLSLNGGVQAIPNDFSQSGTFEEFLEEGTFDASYELTIPPQVDGALLIRVWRNMRAGVAVSHLFGETSTAINASVPHPFFFNQPRSVSGSDDLARRETATHGLLAWPFTLSPSFELLLEGGPSFIHVEQAVVDEIAYEHAFPFNEATFQSAVAPRVKENAIGFNVGMDLSWSLSRRFALGALFRYSRASVDLRASDRNSVSSDAGGLFTGGGLRVRF